MLVIFSSGTVFFTYKNNPKTLAILFLAILILFSFKRKFNSKNLIIFSVLSFAIILNALINRNSNIEVSNVINYIIKMFFIMLLCNNMEQKDFKEKFINIMFILSIISIFCFVYSEFNLNNPLPFTKNETFGSSSFVYTPYFTFGWITSFHRNAGMFWEPGAFQIFINIALLFLLDKKSLNRNNIIQGAILLLTLITTKSTTGYIIFTIIFLNYVYNLIVKFNLIKIKGINSKNKSIVVVFIIAVVISIGLLNSDVITKKFNADSPSFSIRQNDIFGTIDIIKERPLLGYGILSQDLLDMQNNRNIGSNSNGILYFTAMVGVVISGMIFYIIFRNLKYLCKNLNYKVIMLVIILFNVTEVIVFMPIALIFLFRFNEETNHQEVA